MLIRIIRMIAFLPYMLGLLLVGIACIFIYIYNGKGAKLMQWYDKYDPVDNWHPVTVHPPDTLVEVQDKNGNIAKAYPTYYPFKFVKDQSGGKSKVIPRDPYWDGGWLIECQGLESNINSSIVRWRISS